MKSLPYGCTADSQCLFKLSVFVANSVLLTTTVCKVLRELYTSQMQQAATCPEPSVGDGEVQKGGWERGPQLHSGQPVWSALPGSAHYCLPGSLDELL